MKSTPSQRAEINLQYEIARKLTELEFLHAHRALIDKIDKMPYVCGDFLDFDNLNRPSVLELIKAFPGHWDKSNGYNGGVHYTRRELLFDRYQIRLYNGEPPAACVIEETVEYVEIPARTERVVRRTLKCPEPTEDRTSAVN